MTSYNIRSQPVVGKCWQKCPVSEMKFREANNLLSIFEILNGTKYLPKPKCDPSKTVKEFRRSAAGEILNDPLNLRPGSVLIQTVSYLLREVTPRTDVSFRQIYDFVFDRLRSVKQDLIIQQIPFINPKVAVQILEKCYNFYAYALSKMKQDKRLAMDRYNNRIHMLECLTTLVEIYRTSSDDETKEKSAIYLSCYLMCNMDSTEALNFILSNFPKHVRKIEPLFTTLDISLAYQQGNFIRVFKLCNKLLEWKYHLLLFSILDNVDKCRREALEILSVSHNSKAFGVSIVTLKKWLLLQSNDDVVDLCKKYGFSTVGEKMIFQKSQFVVPNEAEVSESYLVQYSRTEVLLKNMILT